MFVVSNTGRIHGLKPEATIVDYAYKVHTDFGNHLVSAKVNNIPVPIDTRLCNGDIVEMSADDQSNPSIDWLDFAKTKKARRQIRKWCNQNGTRTD